MDNVNNSPNPAPDTNSIQWTPLVQPQGKDVEWSALKPSAQEEEQMRIELARPEAEEIAKKMGPVAAATPNIANVPIVGPLLEKGLAYGAAATGLSPVEGDTTEEAYRATLARNKAIDEALKATYPKAGAVGTATDIASAVLATPSLGVETGLTKVAPALGRAIPTVGRTVEGGVYGATSNIFGGAPGETMEDATKRVAEDAGWGMAAPNVIAGLSKLTLAPLKTGYNFTKDIFNPKGGEYRELAIGAREIPGKVSDVGLSPEEYARKKAAGQDVSIMDVQGVRPRVAQAAARLPEDINIADINARLQSRFQERGETFGDTLDAAWGKKLDPFTSRQASQEAARLTNDPLYQAAYGSPKAQGIWNDNLQTMINTDAGQKALDDALERAKMESFNKGIPMPDWPFVKNQDGIWTARKGVTPNLQFWDYVKRGLNTVTGKQKAAGDGSYAATAEMTRNFTDFLKRTVPEYDTALSNAGKYIRGDNAFDAGMEFFDLANAARKTSPRDAKDVGRQLNAFKTKYTPEEKIQMAEGLTSYIKENPYQAAQVFSKADKTTMGRYKAVLGEDKFNQIDDALRIMRLSSMTKEIGQAASNKNIYGPILAGTAGLGIGATVTQAPWMIDYIKNNPIGAMGVATVFTLGAAGKYGLSAQGNRKAAALLEIAASDDSNVAQNLLRAAEKDKSLRLALKSLEGQVSRVFVALNSQKEEPPAGERKYGGRVARQAGGRVQAAQSAAESLMKAAESAKKGISKTTEALLDQPDEHIAKALEIAKQHI